MRLDYVSVHPPFEPDDIYQAANMARGFANTQPQMQIKGVTIGEYPYYMDDLAVHVRFFLAFESAWNVVWAAKSNYEENDHNSGLIDRSGRKLPVYWLYYQYARMEGKRLATTKGGGYNHVQVLASYSGANRRAQMLVGNDGGSDETIVLTLKNVTGAATVRVHGFTGSGTNELSENRRSASGGELHIALGTVADKDARYVSVDFDMDQPGTPQPPPPQDPYGGSPHAIPGIIQAEDYDQGGEGVAYHDSDVGNSGGSYRPAEGVDVKATTDGGGGYVVGWVESGEWLEYTVDVAQAGTYLLEIRVGSAESGGVCHLEFEGVDKTGGIACPNTGSWDAYQTVSVDNVDLDTGRQVMRLSFDGGAMDVNYLSFELATPAVAGRPEGPGMVRRRESTIVAGGIERQVTVPSSAPGFEVFSLQGRRLWRFEDGVSRRRAVALPARIGSGMLHIRYLENETSARGAAGRYIRD
jgi:hypothetical protein